MYTFDGISRTPKLYSVVNDVITEATFSYTSENMAALMHIVNTTGIVLGGDNTAETSCELYEIEKFAFIKKVCTSEDLKLLMKYGQ